MKAPKQESLPLLFNGKDDIEPIMESDDPWDIAEYQKRVQEYSAETSIPDDAKDHDDAVSGVIKGLKGVPKPEDLTLVHSMINSHPDRSSRWRLMQKHINPIIESMPKYEHTNITSPESATLTLHDLAHMKKMNLIPLNGRKVESADRQPFSGENMTFHLDENHVLHPTSQYHPASIFPQFNTEDHDDLRVAHSEILDDHRKTISKYTEDSKELNSHMTDLHMGTVDKRDRSSWKQSVPEVEDHARDVAKMISSAPSIDKSFSVYTGVSKSTDIMKATQGGKNHAIFIAPTFMSTSLDADTAAAFAKRKSPEAHEKHALDEIADVLHVHVPDGFSGGAYIHEQSRHPDEHEYLINHGHAFDIDPTPTYTASHRKVVRVWKARVRQKP